MSDMPDAPTLDAVIAHRFSRRDLMRGSLAAALAAGVAPQAVASPAAAEGIDHAGTLRVAEGPDLFGDAVLSLLAEPEIAAALGAAARTRVIDRYSWDARLAPLDALLAGSA